MEIPDVKFAYGFVYDSLEKFLLQLEKKNILLKRNVNRTFENGNALKL